MGCILYTGSYIGVSTETAWLATLEGTSSSLEGVATGAPTFEMRDRDGPEIPEKSGILFQSLSDKEEDRTIETYSEPHGIEQVLKKQTLRMVSFQEVILLLQRTAYRTSLDLQDAHCHIPKHWKQRKYLGFSLAGQNYQLKALPLSNTHFY